MTGSIRKQIPQATVVLPTPNGPQNQLWIVPISAQGATCKWPRAVALPAWSAR